MLSLTTCQCENSQAKGDTNCGTKKQYICELETQNKPPRGHDIDSYKPINGGWCPVKRFQICSLNI